MKMYKLKFLSHTADFEEIKVDSVQRPMETVTEEMTDEDTLIELVWIQNYEGLFQIGPALGKLQMTTQDDFEKSYAISYSRLNRSMNYMTHCYFFLNRSRTEELLQWTRLGDSYSFGVPVSSSFTWAAKLLDLGGKEIRKLASLPATGGQKRLVQGSRRIHQR